ncbi:glycerophosphoryl diester phosphodiesterase membrane domain-containing protein [Microbacterium sp. BK668]|uniref:glycerophosphoryl diester phosphodiesterase membrane domain-containing protein n=1 Tax=Microbacterium sp. BK668 TaxID=2512118 RepID=UPI001060BC0F|nr:glycerophosphoryl diester phosphodiesterase membrane domain-containing protein [Microbacterium sp. BK668]TDN88421.1 glycerophosphoryl diester phosphodiesterase family protein [Microbacterium sp. BK668]
MTAYPAWTPASRPGIIPLHPLTFGTILGRSFAALRQNPRVLLGFALCVQAVAYIVVILAVGAVAVASFSRLDTLQPGTDDYEAVLAGSVAVTVVVGIVLGLAAGALGVLVQGVVVTEVAHAAVAEKLPLGRLWLRVKPVAWRLLAYAFLVLLVIVAAVAVAGFAIFGLGSVAPPAAAGLGILLVLAAIPLVWWLMVKLVLVPSAIILERATIGDAVGRSWRLTRGRFWSTLGILLLLSLIFGGIAQVVSIPFSFLSVAMSTVITPTGDPRVGEIIALIAGGLLSQAVVVLIQAVATVVQATATGLIYIDCRMRHEGLDLDLLAYVERRDAGAVGLPDPYLEHIGRVLAPRPAGYAPAYAPFPAGPGTMPFAAAPAPGTADPDPYRSGARHPAPAPAYPAYPAPPPAYAAYPPPPASAPYPPPPVSAAYPPPPAGAFPPPPPARHPQPDPQQRAATAPDEARSAPPSAPAQPTDGTDRESPWA